MTSSTAAAEQESAAAHPALDAPDRTALLDTLRTEIAKARPHPVAERTLQLILQAALMPQAEPPGYRVVDRHGAPRMHAPGEGAKARPFTLADLIDEQRTRNPGLFLPPEPEPAVVSATEPQESPLAAQAAEMRAATARFLGSQSERARSLAEQSSAQGRALAQSAAGALAALRGRLRTAEADPAKGDVASADVARSDLANGGMAKAGTGTTGVGRERIREALAERFGGLRDRLGGLGEPDGRRGRLWLGAAGTATAAMLLLAVLVNNPRSPETSPAPSSFPAPPSDASGLRSGVPASPAPDPAPSTRAQTAPDNVTPPPEGDGRGDPEPDAPPPAANAVTGSVQVIDTATLKVGGKLVHLFGVEWVRGGQADELARYIAGRSVSCQPAPGSESMNCLVDGRDLSEVVLYNGGGRASPEASPELVAAEDHARSERLGVWKR